MERVKEGLVYVSRSFFRTLELVLAVLVLLATGFVLMLIGTQPGSPAGGSVVLGLVLVAAAAGVLLALTIVVHVSIDAARFVAS